MRVCRFGPKNPAPDSFENPSGKGQEGPEIYKLIEGPDCTLKSGERPISKNPDYGLPTAPAIRCDRTIAARPDGRLCDRPRLPPEAGPPPPGAAH